MLFINVINHQNKIYHNQYKNDLVIHAQNHSFQNFRNTKQLHLQDKMNLHQLMSYEIIIFFFLQEFQYFEQYFQLDEQNQIIMFNLKEEHVNKWFDYYDLNCMKKNHSVY